MRRFWNRMHTTLWQTRLLPVLQRVGLSSASFAAPTTAASHLPNPDLPKASPPQPPATQTLLPENEAARLKALHQYEILDTQSEAAFDDLTRLAAQICNTPVALVSLLDDCRQWFKSKVGIEAAETPRNLAFCTHAILQPEDVLIVPNALEDERFATNPLVTSDPHIRFYAGVPLITPAGYALGTLCVIDRVPRQLSSAQVEALRILSRQVIAQLELRRNLTELARTNEELRAEIIQHQQADAALQQSEEGFRFLAESIPQQVWMAHPQGGLSYVNQRVLDYFASTYERILGWGWQEQIHPEDLPRCLEHWQQALATGEPYEIEFRLHRAADDTYRWHLGRALPRRDAAGCIISWFGTNTDIDDYKRIEEERRQLLAREQAARTEAEAARQRITNILESITDAFFALDHDWRFTYLNQQAELFLQRSRTDLLGQNIWDKFPQAVDSTFYREYHKAVSQQVSVEFEALYFPHRTWFAVHAYPSKEGLSVYFQDITERKRSQEELQHQHLRSQLFAEVTLKIRQSLQLEEILQTTVTEVHRILQADRVLIFQLWADGSGKVVKEAVASGWPTVLGQSYTDPCFRQAYLQLYRQGRISAIADLEQADIQPCHVEFLQQFGVKANLVVPIFLREDLWGLLIAHQCSQPRQWASFELELLQNLADQMGIALSQAQLLEQEIHQRQELARSEAELRMMSTALESAVEGISRLDQQGRYLMVNRAYANMLGYQPEELIAQKWELSAHPEDLEKLQIAYQQMLVQGKAEVEARGLRKDGSVFDKQIVLVKTCNQEQFIGHYCFVKDISDRRDIERLKDEFVSVVSHELRTPLTSIRGALGLLASGVLQSQPKKGQRMLDISVSNTDRLVRLINDILDIERIESGKVTMTKQVCDAANLMLQSADVVRNIADKAGVTLSVAPRSARLWADPDRIIQTLTNLLSNAIKFSPPHSTVWLTAEIQSSEGLVLSSELSSATQSPKPDQSLPQQILFQVKDQGRGIPADKIEAIFGRFQQVDASDSRKKGGTGLGLAICRSIVQHHGGQIWAESTPGAGSTFFFTLPVRLEKAADVPTPDSGHPLVLVCDDDASVRTVVQTMLEQQGYRAMTVTSGQEAVEQAMRLHPDVILLNLMMPEMDGWETLAVLKEQPQTQEIPIVIFSGLLPDDRAAPPSSVSDWIVKPPDERSLFQALERALAKQKQQVKVLIVEDDLDLAQVLMAMFDRHGVQTFHAQTGREAIQLSQRIMPNLLVLDLILPEWDGFAVVDWLRHHNRLCQVPLVVYTAKDLDSSNRERLKLGQTLFLTKGRITPEEFEQRVINLFSRIIRRGGEETSYDSQTHFGD